MNVCSLSSSSSFILRLAVLLLQYLLLLLFTRSHQSRGCLNFPSKKNIFQNYQRKYDENGKFSSLKAQSSASSPPPKLHLVDYSSEGGVNTQEPIYDVFTNDREEIHHEFEPNSDLEEPTKKKSLITLTHMFKQLIKFLRKKETLRRL